MKLKQQFALKQFFTLNVKKKILDVCIKPDLILASESVVMYIMFIKHTVL